MLGRRGYALESAEARICREVGARVSTNVFLRDLDLWSVSVQDQRRIEVIAEGLPAFHGAQLAIDTTLVSPLRADGVPHRRFADESGAALEAARRRKDRTYPELSGESGRDMLVVLAGEIGGHFSEEALSLPSDPRQSQGPTDPHAFAFSGAFLDVQMGVHVGLRRGARVRFVVARGHPGADGDTPAVSDVLGDFSRAPPSVA